MELAEELREERRASSYKGLPEGSGKELDRGLPEDPSREFVQEPARGLGRDLIKEFMRTH